MNSSYQRNTKLPAVPGVVFGVVGRELLEPAVFERHACRPAVGFEAHVDLGFPAVDEHEPAAGLPHGDGSHRPPFAARAVVHLEQAAADERFEADRHRARVVVEVVRAALVPGVDLVGEDRERSVDVHVDVDRNTHRRGRPHRVPPEGGRARSACCLKRPSCSDQNAWTWSSHACNATKFSARSE